MSNHTLDGVGQHLAADTFRLTLVSGSANEVKYAGTALLWVWPVHFEPALAKGTSCSLISTILLSSRHFIRPLVEVRYIDRIECAMITAPFHSIP